MGTHTEFRANSLSFSGEIREEPFYLTVREETGEIVIVDMEGDIEFTLSKDEIVCSIHQAITIQNERARAAKRAFEMGQRYQQRLIREQLGI